MKLLDLFSGIGGFSLAAKWVGIETVAFCEIDKFCQKVLEKNFPGVPVYDDIKNILTFPHVDIITAGLPCQPFSIAGKQKGKKDSRYLWPELLRMIRIVKPNWCIIENVTGIVGMELDNILDDLEKENYSTQTYIIPACAAEAPHRRDRVWIVANINSERCNVWLDPCSDGHIQINQERNIAEIQSKWEKFKLESWTTFEVADLLTNVNSITSNEADSSSLTFTPTKKTRLGYSGQNRDASTGDSRKIHIPEVCRMDDGLSRKLDTARIKALGNSIVPQIAYVILSGIKIYEKKAPPV